MDPQTPQQPNNQAPEQQPQYQQPPVQPSVQQPVVQPQYTAPQPVAAVPRKSRTKLALWLMIGPSALFLLAIILSVASTLLFNNSPSEGNLFGETSPLHAVFNILFFLSALVTFVTWLPGMIIGIVLLVKQSK